MIFSHYPENLHPSGQWWLPSSRLSLDRFPARLTCLGNPLFEMCCFQMGIARKGRVGAKACQDDLGRFFPTFARMTEGGGAKAVWAMPI